MSNLTDEGAFGISAVDMLSIGQFDHWSSIDAMHGLAQCTTDISAHLCSRCLQIPLNQIHRGARVYIARASTVIFMGLEGWVLKWRDEEQLVTVVGEIQC